MAIPEELRETVFSYCKEEDTPDTLGPMTAAWDGAEGYLEGAGVTRPAPESKRHRSFPTARRRTPRTPWGP